MDTGVGAMGPGADITRLGATYLGAEVPGRALQGILDGVDVSELGATDLGTDLFGCGRHSREADCALRRAAAACAPLPRDAWLGLRGKLSSHCESVTGWLAGFTAHSNRFMIQSTVFNVKLELM